MRNPKVCERNRKNRLLDAADIVTRLPAYQRERSLAKLRTSHDWRQATRVTRGIVNEFIELWTQADAANGEQTVIATSELGVTFDRFEA